MTQNLHCTWQEIVDVPVEQHIEQVVHVPVVAWRLNFTAVLVSDCIFLSMSFRRAFFALLPFGFNLSLLFLPGYFLAPWILF